MDGIPKKIKLSMLDVDGSVVEYGKMEWDGDKWFISGKRSERLKTILGTHGKLYKGKILTFRDRLYCLPLLASRSNLVVDVIESEYPEIDVWGR